MSRLPDSSRVNLGSWTEPLANTRSPEVCKEAGVKYAVKKGDTSIVKKGGQNGRQEKNVGMQKQNRRGRRIMKKKTRTVFS